MPSPVVLGFLKPCDPAVLAALRIVVQRCQPIVQHLLVGSSKALKRASNTNSHTHLQTPRCIEPEGACWHSQSAPDDYIGVGSRLQAGIVLRVPQPRLHSALGSRPCAAVAQYGHLASDTDHDCMHRPTSRASEQKGSLALCRVGSTLSGTSERWSTHHCSKVLSDSAAVPSFGLGHLLQTTKCRAGQPASGGYIVLQTRRGLHASPGVYAASFENIGEASARKATALEYKISADDAIHKFQEWSAGHWLGPIRGVEDHAGRGAFTSIRTAYQPFWVFDAKVTTLFSGEIGFDYNTSTYNSSTKRYESSNGTVWRQAPYTHSLKNDHVGDQPEMQIYASYRYRKAYMSPLKGASLVRETQPLTGAMLAEGRELDPFTMKREIAWRRVREKIQQKEMRKAEEFLKTTYQADQARGIQLQMQFESVRARATYAPAYLLEYQHAGQFFLAVVNGATGEVGAERHLSAVKVGGLVAAGLSVASVATHALGWGSLVSGAWGAALVAGVSVLAGYAAERWLPRVSAYWKELQHGRDVFEDTARAARSGGAEEAGMGEDDDGERERREHWQKQARYQQWQGFGGGAFNEQFERILREFEEQFRRQGGGGFGPFGMPPGWEQQYDRSGFDARRQGERQRQQQQSYEEQFRSRQTGQRAQARPPGYRSSDPLGYYRELGLTKGARSSDEEVKSAFRRLALEWHPDRHGQDPNGKAKAEEKFKKISQAYQVLRDPRKKANYDAGFAG